MGEQVEDGGYDGQHGDDRRWAAAGCGEILVAVVIPTTAGLGHLRIFKTLVLQGTIYDEKQ